MFNKIPLWLPKLYRYKTDYVELAGKAIKRGIIQDIVKERNMPRSAIKLKWNSNMYLVEDENSNKKFTGGSEKNEKIF